MKKKDDTHRSGKRCGYELLPDGRIVIAPKYKDEFEMLGVEEAAIKMLFDSMTTSCHTIMKSITSRKKDLWERVKDDYGLGNNLSYQDGIITVNVNDDGKDSKS